MILANGETHMHAALNYCNSSASAASTSIILSQSKHLIKLKPDLN
jgi:hypothetical protein